MVPGDLVFSGVSSTPSWDCWDAVGWIPIFNNVDLDTFGAGRRYFKAPFNVPVIFVMSGLKSKYDGRFGTWDDTVVMIVIFGEIGYTLLGFLIDRPKKNAQKTLVDEV